MERRRFLTTAGGLTGIAIAGCLSNAADDAYDIGMSAAAFLPDTYPVEVGESVLWRNSGSRPHTVTAYDDGLPSGAEYFATGDFESQEEAVAGWSSGMGGAIHAGEDYEHTFQVPGAHHYYCIPHEVGGMIGTIQVEE